MRILGLHGYLQNGDMMKDRISKLLGKNHEIICPNGPYVIAEDKYGWWSIPSKEELLDEYSYGDLSSLFSFFGSIGPIDLIIGFSQGTVLATILIGKNIIRANKIVLFSPLLIVDQSHLFGNKIDIPTLIVIGNNDSLVPSDISIQVSKDYYNNAVISYHQQGHVIPNNSYFRDAYKII